MASHPYISGAGNVTAIITQLRKNFPTTVTSDTVKKFGLASNNESYLINALQFIGVIDEEGKKTDKAKVLAIHNADQFQPAFETLLKEAYKDLFDTHGDGMWTLSRDALVNYFRTTDQTSDAIGRRQAGVFQAFAAIAGHAETEGASKSTAKPKATGKAKPAGAGVKKTEKVAMVKPGVDGTKNANRAGVALSVRIEINLPAGGTQETYDAIFKSIKANLIDE